ncbi:MAG TPA: Ig-like domain-containing protein [Chthonomonadaceae bacterium]|nr:Ig-like domain-containing protein [Chthonomonadaceae bacterium]
MHSSGRRCGAKTPHAAHRSLTLAARLVPLLLLGLLALTGSAAFAAQIKLSTPAKDGEKISDVYTLVAKAESPDGIDKVEFRVDDQLRFTDTSTPYEFEWDTLADTEGPHKVTITAYDSNGATKRLALTLVIANELDLGAEALAQKAQDALRAKEDETAARYARRALKVDPANLSANRVQASLYAQKGEWDKAIAALEKAKIPDSDTETMQQLASYRMQRALLPENAANFATDLQAVVELRRKVDDIAVNKAMEKNKAATENSQTRAQAHEDIGDRLMEAGRYSEAIQEYKQCGQEILSTPADCVNRLALAYVLTNQMREARLQIEALTREKRDTPATHAIWGLLLLRTRQFREARDAVQPDIAAHYPGALIIAAFADTVLRKREQGAEEAKEAARLLPDAADAQYALAATSLDLRESERALHRALALNPYQSGPILDYAARQFVLKNITQERIDQLLNVVNYVLKRDPDNVNAKLMQVMLYLQANRVNDAEPILAALLQQENTALDLLFAGSVYSRYKENFGQITRFLEAINRLSPETYYDVTNLSKPQQAIAYFDLKRRYRADPFLTVTTLFAPKSEATSAP